MPLLKPPTFGAEIEFLKTRVPSLEGGPALRYHLGDMADIVRLAITEAGFEGDRANVQTREANNVWTSKFDGPNHEITTPVLEAALQNIETFGRAVQNIGRILDRYGTPSMNLINYYAGLHIHVGLGGADIRQIINLARVLWYCEEILIKLQGPDRESWRVCDRGNNPRHFWERLASERSYLDRGESCFGGGFTFFRRGLPTVEIRYGQCVFNAEDVAGWVKLLIILVNIGLSLDGEFTCENRDADTELVINFLDQHRDLIDEEFRPEVENVTTWMLAKIERTHEVWETWRRNGCPVPR